MPLRSKLNEVFSIAFRTSPRLRNGARSALLRIDRTYDGSMVPLVAFFPARLAYRVALLRSDLRYRMLGSGDITSIRFRIYLRLVTPLAAIMPAWFAYGLALLYADARRRSDRTQFQEVLLCLEQVMGSQLSPKARREVACDYFRNRACMRMDAMRLTGDGHHLINLVSVRGEEFISDALAEGRGVILCTAHYGSVRACAGILGALGFPVTLIAEWSFTPYQGEKQATYQFAWKPIEHHMRRANIVAGKTNIAAAVEAAAVLKQNELLITNIDVGVHGHDRNRAISLDFMNGHALVIPGAVSIAKLTGAPLLMVFIRRSRDWRHLTLEILPRVPVIGDGTSAMQTCMKEVESVIRLDPAQWEHWSMRSLAHLGLYPEDKAANFYRSTNRRWNEL